MNREDRSKLRKRFVQLFAHKQADHRSLSEREICHLVDVDPDANGVLTLIELIRDLMTDPIKCRVIVSMHGGVIDSVVNDNEQVKITDVVFLEDPKYQSEEPEFFVEVGEFRDQFVYTHRTCDLGSDADFGAVMSAAQRRIQHAKATDKVGG